MPTFYHLINVHRCFLFLKKISSMDAIIKQWTLINFLAKFQDGRLLQRGDLLILAKYIGRSNVVRGHVRSQDFFRLIRAVKKFHLKHIYSRRPFYLNWKYCPCTSLIGDAFVTKTILDPFWQHFLPFPTSTCICYK